MAVIHLLPRGDRVAISLISARPCRAVTRAAPPSIKYGNWTLLTASDSPYHCRPNGSASEIRLTPRNAHQALAIKRCRPDRCLMNAPRSRYTARRFRCTACAACRRAEKSARPHERHPLLQTVDWLDRFDRPNDYEEADQSPRDDPTRNHVWCVARFRTSLRKINHETEG